MRLAVTGATGTVGRAFVEQALGAGHSVVMLGRTAPKVLPEGCQFCEFDLTAPPTDLKPSLQGVDCAVHLAASIDTNPADDAAATALWTTNVLGTGRLIEALAKAGVSHFVMASSANIYDPLVERADEQTPIRPQSRTLYLSSKAAQEAFARELCRKHGIGHAVLRISSVIGTENDIVAKFLAMTLEGKTITLANPEYGADFVALNDVAAGLLLAAEKRLEGDFNLSSGERHTLEDLAHTIAKVCSVPVSINESGPHGAPDKGFPAIACSKLSGCGYNPTALPDIIARMKSNITLSDGASL
ncbi:MAG: NAD(P)-dependent oxidoreductase [Pseudomonadota bacterium]